MRSKHYAQIIAKAENMSLVTFHKMKVSARWYKCITLDEMPRFKESQEYFTCHPKHTEVVLKWLNGRAVYVKYTGGKWVRVPPHETSVWCNPAWYMDSSVDSKVASRALGMWVIYAESYNNVAGGRLFETRSEAEEFAALWCGDVEFYQLTEGVEE